MDKILNKIVYPVILIPCIYLAFVWNKLPATVSVHFDLRGNADRYGNKNELLLPVIIISAISLFIYVLFLNIHRLDTKKQAIENKSRLQRMGFALVVFMASINCMIIYSAVSGASAFNIGLVLGSVGLLFTIIGNYMPNIKPNYFAGFRLPWTLENADNWRKTHALAGRLWFFGGLLISVICILAPTNIVFFIFLAITLIITIIPGVYSYQLFKKAKTSSQAK